MRYFPPYLLALGLLPITLLAGCADESGTYPSLLPRSGEEPRHIDQEGTKAAPSLSAEEGERLQQSLAEERRALAAVLRDATTAHTALQKEMSKAGHAPTGSKSWGDAQTALSRYNLAWEPLRQIDTRLASLALLVTDLPSEDPQYQQVSDLQKQVSVAIARHSSISEKADQQLSR